MVTIARKSDGRRIFTDEFKRDQIGRVRSGELTLAELSRELGIARSLLQRWKRSTSGNGATGQARGRTTRTSELQATHYIRELQRLVGKQTVELELCRAELDTLKKGRRSQGLSKR